MFLVRVPDALWLSGFDDPEVKKVVEELWGFQGDIITASGILIAIPLLELSFLATFGGLSKIDLGIVAIPILVSAVLFATAIFATTSAKRQYLGLKLIAALGKSLVNMPDEVWKNVDLIAGTKIKEPLMKEISKSVGKRWTLPFGGLGITAFFGGITSLVISLIMLALFLL